MFGRKHHDKAKLEHKLYLARETPEPVFDISDCSLHEVPSGIYSLCRVFLKESLLLNNNCLSSLSGGGELNDLQLLKVLNISNNQFSHLPDDIHILKSLQELYLSHNQLRQMCDSICKLSNLQVLDVSHNLLKALPVDIGELKQLKKLDITENKKLRYLPKSFYRLHRLKALNLDADCFCYPPKEVVEDGIDPIRRFICDDIGVNYESIEPQHEDQDSETKINDEVDLVQAKIWELEQLKLLAMLTEEQVILDEKLNKIHRQKETERFRLIERLQEEENNAHMIINELLSLDNTPLEQLIEQEEKETEKLLAMLNEYDESLRKDDILKAMQNILEQETAMLKQVDEDRMVTSKSILEQQSELDGKLADVLRDQEECKAKLVNDLNEDTDLQKAAVATLLERGDARSWGLLQQIRLVESQLARLTNIEMDRKKLQMNQHLNNLCDQRIGLSCLLISLIDQQKERQLQLISTLQGMEESSNDIDDFWLKQYQRLLDQLPEGLSQAQKNIDPSLAHALLVNGVIHCLPFLAKLTQSQYDLSEVTDHDLFEAGLNSGNDRRRILDAFQMYKKEKHLSDNSNIPSAPPLLDEASAPPAEEISAITTVECVICLDMECQIIFLPCGHLCCCQNCGSKIATCPLCRIDVEKVIKMHANI
ncbi:unnamed protein product [Acanthoscelides obtectus]|uniref:RING-type domain-containing protein n=1 Tax=Acanthoscelides obtectus TaxID=200917 RepID=A0A9P0PUE1_ACAOB|nr:unnamed protein product [Acanthoscelides obtectus]CAK1650071.1 E3 ubiquitin-protein ligase LRSAM1 [Acanthoscelides obtectus]